MAERADLYRVCSKLYTNWVTFPEKFIGGEGEPNFEQPIHLQKILGAAVLDHVV